MNSYITIPKQTREDDPLCYCSAPHIVSTSLGNNPFQALAQDDETISIQELGLAINELTSDYTADNIKDTVAKQHDSTADIIQQLDNTSNAVGAEIEEIATIISKDDPKHTPDTDQILDGTSPVVSGLDHVSVIQKEDAHQYLMDQTKIITTQHEQFLKTTIYHEIKRVFDTLNLAKSEIITDIKNMSTQQHKSITEVSTTTINQCSQLCADAQSTTESHSANIIATLTDKIHAAESNAISTHNKQWWTLSTKMANTHANLVSTNGIAIKNTTILENKLKAAEAKFKSLY